MAAMDDKTIADEVSRQLAGVNRSIWEVQKLNEEQTRRLGIFDERQAKIEAWLLALWGNGSGRLGYLDKVFADQSERLMEHRNHLEAQYKEIFLAVTELQKNVLREEGKETLRVEIQKLDAEKLAALATASAAADMRRTNRWSRWQTWIAIGLAVGGAVAGYAIHLLKMWRHW